MIIIMHCNHSRERNHHSPHHYKMQRDPRLWCSVRSIFGGEFPSWPLWVFDVLIINWHIYIELTLKGFPSPGIAGIMVLYQQSEVKGWVADLFLFSWVTGWLLTFKHSSEHINHPQLLRQFSNKLFPELWLLLGFCSCGSSGGRMGKGKRSIVQVGFICFSIFSLLFF